MGDGGVMLDKAGSDSLILPPVSPVTVEMARLTRDDIEVILRTWQKRMYLDHWKITLMKEPPEVESDYASISRHESYDYADLRINAEFAKWSRRMANLVIVHELMHLHTRGVEYAAESVEGVLNAQARTLWHDRFDNEVEALVDKVATMLVDAGGVV